jgi:hypothetical protein
MLQAASHLRFPDIFAILKNNCPQNLPHALPKAFSALRRYDECPVFMM